MEIVLSDISIGSFKKLNMCIFDAKVTAIIGDNASGKSIIGEVLSTLRKPDSGKFIIDKNVLDLKRQDVDYNRLRFDIGYVIQNTDITFFERTVEEHMAYQLSVYNYKNVITDTALNVVNSYSVALLHSLGVDRITLSYELNTSQIKDIVDSYHKRYKKHPNLEVVVCSYPEVMVCKYKLNGDYLKDRFNNLFRIKIIDDYMYIYHYKKINIKEDLYKLGIN